jgi:hypothetical protein
MRSVHLRSFPDRVTVNTREFSMAVSYESVLPILTENAAPTDSEGKWPERSIAALKEAALLGLTLPLVDESLVILAAGGLAPERIAFGIRARTHLYEMMNENRIKRLVTIGFNDVEAEELSCLHTPNFM